MVLAYISTNYYRDVESNTLHPSQKTAKALLSSSIADGDVLTDWIYFFDIIENASDNAIPQWLILLQLVSCICGTMSWLAVGTDGRAVKWIRYLFWLMIIVLLLPVPAIIAIIVCDIIHRTGENSAYEKAVYSTFEPMKKIIQFLEE